MLAIDTNILVRFLTDDDAEQSPQARALIERNDILISSTVMLETDWVLRSAYGLNKLDVISRLTAVAGLPRVILQEPDRIAKALNWAAAGMDFADALHVSAAEGCEAFVTFDRRLAGAQPLGGPPIRMLAAD